MIRPFEAEGFVSTLDGLSDFDWTQNHGASDFEESDFVTPANTTQRRDQVDRGPNFGRNDLKIFATHTCALLEQHRATVSDAKSWASC